MGNNNCQVSQVNTSSKSSTPLTEVPAKSVIQSNTGDMAGQVVGEDQETPELGKVTPQNDSRSPVINQANNQLGNQQRGSVVRALDQNPDVQVINAKNGGAGTTSPDMLTPEGVSSNERRLSKSVISEINETDESAAARAMIGEIVTTSTANENQVNTATTSAGMFSR